MHRRELILASAGVLLLRPLAPSAHAQAQPQAPAKRVGVLMASAETDPDGQQRLNTFVGRLAELGWGQDRNTRFETRWGAGSADLFRQFAREIVALRPDVILSDATPATVALQRETREIPLVFTRVSDPVGQGFVPNLARPTGNATGFMNIEPSFGGKWLEILSELAPGVRRAVFLYNPQTAPYGKPFLQSVETAGRTKGIETIDGAVGSVADIERIIAEAARTPGLGLLVLTDSYVTNHRDVIIAIAGRLRLPAVYPVRQFTDAGGLASYGNHTLHLYSQAAVYADRILRGAKPADLPVQAPTKFEFVINLKTAKALGIEVPPMLLARADEVIE